MTLCRYATLQSSWTKYVAFASPFVGYVTLYISCTEQWLLRTAQLLIFVQKLEKMFSPMCFFFSFCMQRQAMYALTSEIFCCGSKAVKDDCAQLFSISVQCFRPFMFSGYVRNAVVIYIDQTRASLTLSK